MARYRITILLQGTPRKIGSENTINDLVFKCILVFLKFFKCLFLFERKSACTRVWEGQTERGTEDPKEALH